MTWQTANLRETFDTINTVMRRVDSVCAAAIVQLQETTEASYVVDVRASLIKARDVLSSLSTTPGLVEYVRNEVNDGSYDAVANFTAVVNAINAVVANIESTFPADANDWLLIYKFSATNIEERTFTAANTATLRGLLQTVEDSIT